MNILFIDDQPHSKLTHLIYYLKQSHTDDFTYEIKESVNSACRYFVEHLTEINLVIVDLGLPMFDDGKNYNSLNGLKIVETILRKTINIPIIINSTTHIPDEAIYLQKFKNKNAKIAHVDFVHVDWLTHFIKNNL